MGFFIPGSALLGATLLSVADLIARMSLRPAESLGGWTLPFAACAGGVFSTYLVFALAHTKHQGRSSIVRLC
jgi:ABC-type Fe3+-siderophore transport system permease subunit